MSKKLTTKEFIDRTKKLHNNKFDYTLVKYISNQIKVKIICPIHGEFEQRPATHLLGIGCEKCGVEKRASKKRFSLSEFILKSNTVHNNNYDYSLVKYKTIFIKVDIICKKCNTIFNQASYSHLKKHGCPKCNLGSLTGWSKTQWIDFCELKTREPLLYIIRCYNENEEFIKIGRTSTSTIKRFKKKQTMPYEYEVIKEIKGSPGFIFDKEVKLHRLYKEYKYKPLIHFGGETECFNISILKDFV